MAPRRSARLRSRTPVTEEQFPVPPSVTPPKLASVAEHTETLPTPSLPSNNATLIATPQSQTTQKMSTPSKATPSKSQPSSSSQRTIRTPTTAGSMRPAAEEMHPSKAHQSTTKQPDPGLVLGFNPVKRDSTGKAIKETVVTNTPSKVIASPPSKLDSPSKFDFKFSTDDSQLSDEARKLMHSVREDVARIKAQMILERGEQQRKEQEAVDGRKIAKPKGKAGRFSNAHMNEFKKMDSIAGHASSFRAQPGRFQPVQRSLKRKSSKASLDEPEQKPSPSKQPLGGAKRLKRSDAEDTSRIPPPADITTPKKTVPPRPPIRNRYLMTPTKSSVARFASARASKTSMIPSLNRSPVSRLTAPRTPKTDFNPRRKEVLPSPGNLKSILKRRQPLFSEDPSKIAAGTHLAAPSFKPEINLENLPTASFGADSQTPSPKKRVNFTSSTKTRYEVAQSSPTPSKIPGLRVGNTTPAEVVYPTLPSLTQDGKEKDTPTIRRVRNSAGAAQSTSPLASFPSISHGIPNKNRQHSSEQSGAKPSDSIAKSPVAPPAPANEPHNMLTVPHGIENKKRRRISDGDQSNEPTKGVPNIISSNSAQKSPSTSLLAVPHGINYKKRQRMDDDLESENIPPATTPTDEQQRSAKRLKASPIKMNPVSPSPLKSRGITPKRAMGSRTGTPSTASKKGVLSLSRLNMLAKPKSRG